MDMHVLLKEFKARFDPKISAYFDAIQKKIGQEDELVGEAMSHVRSLTLAGGKRLRPACMFYGYTALGGTDEEAILETAVSIELLHTFLLIHDDIIDRDNLRHGEPTLHRRYADFGRQYFPGRDVEHFGSSIALIVGDLLFALSNDIIFQSPFPRERVFHALSQLQSVVSYTVMGQARDIYMEYRREGTEAEILQMYTNKTARYTMERPIQIGMLLAQDVPVLLDQFSKYALPLGVAFQIQDDVLGVFGSEKKMGKPVGSDIMEGKFTLLVIYALEQGTSAERSELKHILSRGKELTLDDVERFRALVVSTGALKRSQDLARQYVGEGKLVLRELRSQISPQSFDFFDSVADYMAEREC